MKTCVLFGILAALAVTCLPASAQVIISEDFESYANDTALYSVWAPPTPSNDDGILIDETYVNPFPADPMDPVDTGARAFNPNDDGSTGQGVDHLAGSFLDYVNLNGGVPLVPTATKNLVLQGDIFDTLGSGNKRVGIGLRSTSSPVENLVELGQWNSAEANGYAYRAILFPTPPETPNPNWAAFDALPIELDRLDDADTIVTIADIGEAWATYRAIIGVDTITYEIDLFRDGLRNDTATTGVPGVDMSITVPNLITTANGYSSLRIGGPSGVTSGGGGVVFDNISLELVDVVAGPITGDYNGNGTVDAADYTLYRDTVGDSVTAGTGADGNNDGFITALDYDVWVANFGNTSSTSSAVSVPEPTTVLLACFAGLAMTGLRRSV